MGFDGQLKRIDLQPGQLAFSCCMVPVVYTKATSASITVLMSDGSTQQCQGATLSAELSRLIIGRTGAVARIEVQVVLGA